MKKNLLKDLSASTIQLLLNYLSGLLIFLITSRFLDKSEFGELNWSLALLVFFTTILSLRLEQIVVRKVAAGDNPSRLLTIFTAHIVLGGLLFYLLLFACSFIFPSFFQEHNMLLLLAISQLLSFFSLPFKQLANGKEKFGYLAIMSTISNIIRSIWLLLVVIFSFLTIRQVLVIYIISSLIELAISFFLARFRLHTPLSAQWQLKDYFDIMKESLPQIGSSFFNAAIARMDWILLGFFTTPLITAEYSFAYKVFELCPLPLLILSPVLLSRFSKFFSARDEKAFEEKSAGMDLLIRCEVITACFIALAINILWIPLAGSISAGKYGEANQYIFLLLSISLPLQFLTNLLWTLHFSLNHLKKILKITAVTCIVMFACDIILIPLYGAMGAAIGYCIAQISEYIQYAYTTRITKLKSSWQPLLVCFAGALLSGLLVNYLFTATWLKLLAATGMFLGWIVAGRQLKLNDLLIVKQILKSK